MALLSSKIGGSVKKSKDKSPIIPITDKNFVEILRHRLILRITSFDQYPFHSIFSRCNNNANSQNLNTVSTELADVVFCFLSRCP